MHEIRDLPHDQLVRIVERFVTYATYLRVKELPYGARAAGKGFEQILREELANTTKEETND